MRIANFLFIQDFFKPLTKPAPETKPASETQPSTEAPSKSEDISTYDTPNLPDTPGESDVSDFGYDDPGDYFGEYFEGEDPWGTYEGDVESSTIDAPGGGMQPEWDPTDIWATNPATGESLQGQYGYGETMKLQWLAEQEAATAAEAEYQEGLALDDSVALGVSNTIGAQVSDVQSYAENQVKELRKRNRSYGNKRDDNIKQILSNLT